jgi:hypothetical protein
MTSDYRKITDLEEVGRLCRGEGSLSGGDIELLRRKFFQLGLLGTRSRPLLRSWQVIDIFGNFNAMDLMLPICFQDDDGSTVFVWRDRSRVRSLTTNHQVLKVYVRPVGDDDYFLVHVYEVDHSRGRVVGDYYMCDQVRGVGSLLSDMARLYPGLARDYNLPRG